RSRQPGKAKHAARYKDQARRRRVLAAFRSEAELAASIQAVQLPDSEPADVVYAEDANGKPIEDAETIKHILRLRKIAVAELNAGVSERRRLELERFLSQPVHFLEVKSLQTASEDAVHMSREARARKERWIDRYAVPFSVVAIDRRRGSKHSGHEVYVSPGEL